MQHKTLPLTLIHRKDGLYWSLYIVNKHIGVSEAMTLNDAQVWALTTYRLLKKP